MNYNTLVSRSLVALLCMGTVMAASDAPREEPKRRGNPRVAVVQKGDCPEQIARLSYRRVQPHSSSMWPQYMRSFREMNGLDDAAVVHPGDLLILPRMEEVTAIPMRAHASVLTYASGTAVVKDNCITIVNTRVIKQHEKDNVPQMRYCFPTGNVQLLSCAPVTDNAPLTVSVQVQYENRSDIVVFAPVARVGEKSPTPVLRKKGRSMIVTSEYRDVLIWEYVLSKPVQR